MYGSYSTLILFVFVITGGTAFASSLLRGREKIPRAAMHVFGWARMLVLDDARDGVLGSAAIRGTGGWPAAQYPSLPCALSISMLVMRRSSSSSRRRRLETLSIRDECKLYYRPFWQRLSLYALDLGEKQEVISSDDVFISSDGSLRTNRT